jgi:hypothetical protein
VYVERENVSETSRMIRELAAAFVGIDHLRAALQRGAQCSNSFWADIMDVILMTNGLKVGWHEWGNDQDLIWGENLGYKAPSEPVPHVLIEQPRKSLLPPHLKNR